MATFCFVKREKDGTLYCAPNEFGDHVPVPSSVPCPEGTLVLDRDVRILGNQNVCTTVGLPKGPYLYCWDCNGGGARLAWRDLDGSEHRYTFTPVQTHATPRPSGPRRPYREPSSLRPEPAAAPVPQPTQVPSTPAPAPERRGLLSRLLS